MKSPNSDPTHPIMHLPPPSPPGKQQYLLNSLPCVCSASFSTGPGCDNPSGYFLNTRQSSFQSHWRCRAAVFTGSALKKKHRCSPTRDRSTPWKNHPSSEEGRFRRVVLVAVDAEAEQVKWSREAAAGLTSVLYKSLVVFTLVDSGDFFPFHTNRQKY